MDDDGDDFFGDGEVDATGGMEAELRKKGYRDCIAREEEKARQQAFDEGLTRGIVVGELAGRVFGLARGVPEDAKLKPTAAERVSVLLLDAMSAVSDGARPELAELDCLIATFPSQVQHSYQQFRDEIAPKTLL